MTGNISLESGQMRQQPPFRLSKYSKFKCILISRLMDSSLVDTLFKVKLISLISDYSADAGIA